MSVVMNQLSGINKDGVRIENKKIKYRMGGKRMLSFNNWRKQSE